MGMLNDKEVEIVAMAQSKLQDYIRKAVSNNSERDQIAMYHKLVREAIVGLLALELEIDD
jgi:hypothetical protein